MAIQGLPTFTLPGEELAKSPAEMQNILDSIMRNKLIPYQAEELKGKAAQSQMLAKLIGQVMGEDGNVGESTASQPTSTGITKQQLLQGLFGIPAETPQQKREAETKQSLEEHQGLSNIKSSEELEDAGGRISSLIEKVNRAKEIFKKRPDLTGPIVGRQAKLGISNDPDLGELQELFGDIQSDIGRMAGDRGGAQLIGWASTIKPDVAKPGIYNMAMLSSLEKGLNNKYKIISSRYNKKTGKNIEEQLGINDQDAQSQSVPNVNNSSEENKDMPSIDEKGLLILYKDGEEYHIPPTLYAQFMKQKGASHVRK